MTRRVAVISIGPGGPEQITLEAVRVLQAMDWFVLTEKDRPDGDPLVAVRAAMLDRHAPGARVVVVPDPARDRSAAVDSETGYGTAVSAWHRARAERYADALRAEPGDVGFLVWGDPSLYDSTIRVLREVVSDLGEHGEQATLEVVPGMSSVSVLAARHATVLHGVGEAVQITTGRRLAEAVAQGQRNIVVMLNRSLAELRALADDEPRQWRIWWGANLGTPAEQLVSGSLQAVLPKIESAREQVRADAGWVLDLYLLQRISAPTG